MISEGHPFLVRFEVEHWRSCAKVFEELLLRNLFLLGVFGEAGFFANRANADVCGLHSCLVAEEIAESDSVRYFEE